MKHLDHLFKDKKLKKIIDGQKPYRLSRSKNIHLDLCNSIMSQQLSTKVAEIINARFIKLYEGEPSPERIMNTSTDKLRSIGLSNAKASYLQNVARFALDFGMDHAHLDKMENEQIIEYLTQIKGVGKWTVEMILMFTLGREDVFAIDDLGIQQSMAKLYKLDSRNKKKFREELLSISDKWKPFRTYACIYLWRWKDAGALQNKNKPKATR
ncbi:MAG: DNA-3-methyladenine glycosylase 2 family protein [Bacteroidetes bacterium]|nr:MAG: DNA-3-methyladenine glycosylase 2 family protein [Bacteroidota bacterium]